MEKVSVIIPTYNRQRRVLDAINSALSQTYQNLEVIVVDDGSSDKTQENVLAYKDRVRYFYKANGGCSSARNMGIQQARGNFIAFLDSDDVWSPQKIEKQMINIQGNNDCGIVISEIEAINDDSEHLYYSDMRKYIPYDGYIFAHLLARPPITCSYMLVRKEAFDTVGLFDESLSTGEDFDMLLRICSVFKASVIDEPLLKYRISKDRISGLLFTRNRLKVLDKINSYAPELARGYRRNILKSKSDIHLSYADDLLFNRYLTESRSQILASLKNRFSFKGLLLYTKSWIVQVVGLLFASYRNKGNYNPEPVNPTNKE